MIEIKVNNGTCSTKIEGKGDEILVEAAVALNGMIVGITGDSGIPRKDMMLLICMVADKMNDSDHVEIHRNGKAREENHGKV